MVFALCTLKLFCIKFHENILNGVNMIFLQKLLFTRFKGALLKKHELLFLHSARRLKVLCMTLYLYKVS